MKKIKLQRRLLSSLSGLALAGSTILCSAADPIVVNTFDTSTEVSSWSEQTGKGTVEWCPDSGGCLKVILPGGTGSEAQPQVALGSKSFNDAQYWSLSFDIKVDPSSSLSSDGTTFGHWQAVVRNSSWSWTGLNWTVLDTSYTNGWRHVEVGFVQPYDTIAYLLFQVTGGGYSGDLIYYLDNIKVTPLPTTVMINAFTNASEVTAYNAWGVTGSGVSWIDSPDAGGLTPAGSMKILGNYDGTVPGWAEASCQRDFSFDPSRFTYFDFDVYLDPASATPYGGITAFLRQNHSPWSWLWIGGHSFSASDAGKWVHVSLAMAPTGETNAAGFVLQTGGNAMTAPVISYVDNIKIYTPQVIPKLSKIEKAGSPGVTITMDQAGSQWQRDAIATPAGTGNYTWYNSGGTTYSFTITNFPDAVAHPGFEAHMYIVNEDTIPGTGPAWNETYGACDWNAADLAVVRLENNASGGVDFSFRFKTNLPNANVDHTVATVHAPSALGTWSVTFGADNISVTLNGPGLAPTNFTLPQEVADRFNCAISFLQFGAFKNDGAASGINDGASATFSRVQMTAGGYPFDDNFSAGLTGTYQWRTTSGSAATWTPEGTGWWLVWSVPDEGFNVEVAGNVAGPYTDAAVSYKYAQGATRVGAVPASSIPAGNAAFFRLSKPVTP